MIGKLQERYGYMKDRAEKEVNTFFARNYDERGSHGRMKSDTAHRGHSQNM